MNFGVKRLPAEDKGRRYHLYDEHDQLILVADHGSPWIPEEPTRHVVFARPNGDPIATLDLPERNGDGKRQKGTSYAVIHEHAVYAIINEHGPENGRKAKPNELPYYTVEVEGMRWLALPHTDPHTLFALYEEVPSGVDVYGEQVAEELPPPVAAVHPVADGYDFVVEMPEERLQQSALLLLALIFLVDRFTTAV